MEQAYAEYSVKQKTTGKDIALKVMMIIGVIQMCIRDSHSTSPPWIYGFIHPQVYGTCRCIKEQ